MTQQIDTYDNKLYTCENRMQGEILCARDTVFQYDKELCDSFETLSLHHFALMKCPQGSAIHYQNVNFLGHMGDLSLVRPFFT